ncbi:fam151a, partial [Symbiodinium pilosum]
YDDLDEEITKIKKEVQTYKDATEEIEGCMEDNGIMVKIGEAYTPVDEDTVLEKLATLVETSEAALSQKSDEIEAVRGELDSLKKVLYAKFGSSINLEKCPAAQERSVLGEAFAWLAAHLGHQRQAHCLSSGARDRLKPWRLFASLPLPALLKSMAVDGRLAFEVTMAEPPPRVAVFSVDLSFDSYFQQRSTFVLEANRRLIERHELQPGRTQWAPLPSPQQVWAHSCVTRAKLEAALKDPKVTAIEVDVAMGYLTGPDGSGNILVPVMAHPPVLTSDLSFEEFLDEVVQDGRRHVKFDFKDLESVQRCLPLLAERSRQLAANEQAVWLNADVLPGPGLRGWRCAVPAEAFFDAAETYCPGAHLSLGWKANPVGLESYTEADCRAMAELCRRHGQLAKGGVVFAVAARTASRNPEPLAALLAQVPGSQLLFWTGTWEPPILAATKGHLCKAPAVCIVIVIVLVIVVVVVVVGLHCEPVVIRTKKEAARASARLPAKNERFNKKCHNRARIVDFQLVSELQRVIQRRSGSCP